MYRLLPEPNLVMKCFCLCRGTGKDLSHFLGPGGRRGRHFGQVLVAGLDLLPPENSDDLAPGGDQALGAVGQIVADGLPDPAGMREIIQ